MAIKRFKTRYGWVQFETSSRSRKQRRPARKSSPASRSKKIGRWRCTLEGGSKARKVVCAGVSHTYQTPGAAKTAYRRLGSQKSVEGFVARYGKNAAKHNNPRRRKARNAPISRSDAATVRRILQRHGYF